MRLSPRAKSLSINGLPLASPMADLMHYRSANPPPELHVSRSPSIGAAVSVAAALAPVAAVAAQQSDVTVSPFVSFLPTAGASPLAGLALTLADRKSVV